MNKMQRMMRLLRMYDAFKMALLLGMLAAVLAGICVRYAVRYAHSLAQQTEYVCMFTGSQSTALEKTGMMQEITAYSPQCTKLLETDSGSVEVVLLSAQYLSDCFGIEAGGASHTVWMNQAALSLVSRNDTRAAQMTCRLDGQETELNAALSDSLPDDLPFAVMYGSAAQLRDADRIRVRMNRKERNAEKLLSEAGLSFADTAQIQAAAYEEKLLLVRLRFGLLSVLLSALGSAAFCLLGKQKAAQDQE